MKVWTLGGVYFLAFLLSTCWAKADKTASRDQHQPKNSKRDVKLSKDNGADAENLGSVDTKSGVQEEHQAANLEAATVLSKVGADHFAALQQNAAALPGGQETHTAHTTHHKSQGLPSGKTGGKHVVSNEANRQEAANKQQLEEKTSNRSGEDFELNEDPVNDEAVMALALAASQKLKPSNNPFNAILSGPSLAEVAGDDDGRFSPTTAIDDNAQAGLDHQLQAAHNLKNRDYPAEHPNSGSSAAASSKALAAANGGSASAGAIAASEVTAERRMGARLVPSSRSFLPPATSAPNGIVCRQQGEMYYYWSPEYECSICACVIEYGVLQAKCASCGGCQFVPDNQLPGYPSMPMPAPPIPAYPPIPSFPSNPAFPLNPIFPPIPSLPPLPQPPYPDPSVRPPGPSPSPNTCAPLPTNTPFQNPLNPCQICICNQVAQPIGGPDIQITCEDNPDCVVPSGATPFPPLAPNPAPEPLCDKLPQNVWFPHPNEECQNCQCTVEQNPLTGLLESYITCVTVPECIPSHPPRPPSPGRPTPPSHPRPPSSVPIPGRPPTGPSPGPSPDTFPSRPSPLPGPKPHQSCRPFTPNVPFEHPWDSCQSCVCEETTARGLITIEVNCYTKKECCIEPPFSVGPAPPRPVQAQPIYLAPSCQYRPPNQPFQEGCDLCTCNVIYNYVVAQCTKVPNCGGASSSASASTIAAANAAATGGATGSIYPGPSGGGSSSASAEAIASAISSIPSSLYPGPIYPGATGGGLASASAEAAAIANAAAIGSTYPGSLYPGSTYPGSTGGLASASADASAIANAGSSYPGALYPGSIYPGGTGGLASASAEASAIANAGSSYPGSLLPGTTYPGLSGGGLASASADASAIANAGSSYAGSLFPGSTYPGLSGGLASASADASAIANAVSTYPGSIYPTPYSPTFPGIEGSGIASALSDASAIASAGYPGSSYPGSTYPGSLYPGSGGGISSASADALAIANAGSSYPGSLYPGASYPAGFGSADASASANAFAGSSSYYSPYGPLYPAYSAGFPGSLLNPSSPASDFGNNYPLSPSFGAGIGGSLFRSGKESVEEVEEIQTTSTKKAV